jgi:hypothetical protein
MEGPKPSSFGVGTCVNKIKYRLIILNTNNCIGRGKRIYLFKNLLSIVYRKELQKMLKLNPEQNPIPRRFILCEIYLDAFSYTKKNFSLAYK